MPQLPTLNDPTAQTNGEVSLTNINWSSYWVEGVNPKSKNQAEAWKFLTFLSTKENLEKLYDVLTGLGYKTSIPIKKGEFLDKNELARLDLEKNMKVVSFYNAKDPFKIIDIGIHIFAGAIIFCSMNMHY